MKIFNFKQASIFILSGCTVLNCGISSKKGKKFYIEFEEDNKLNELMTKWRNQEFI